MALKLRYWGDYGGWAALRSSNWFRLSLAATIVLCPVWTREGWWERVLTIAPNLMGYALGGFAIFLGIGSDGFHQLLSGARRFRVSPLRAVAATFCHFIVVSTLALGAAVACDAFYFVPPEPLAGALQRLGVWLDAATYLVWGVSWLLFMYSMALVVSTANNLMHYTGWLDRFLEKKGQASGSPDVSFTGPNNARAATTKLKLRFEHARRPKRR